MASKNPKRSLLVSIAAALLGGGTAGVAQEVDRQTEADDGMEEIIVTAQKKEQRIEDVPIAMTALGKAELEAFRVDGIRDYAFRIPNLTYNESWTSFQRNISIRGAVAPGGKFDQVSVLVDGIGLSATRASFLLSSQIFDVERIEVLRGPQGTLNGRNALGGSINIVTQKPNFSDPGGSATYDLGRFGTHLGKLGFNAPLAENLAVRLSAYARHSDGAIKNLGAGGGGSGYDSAGGRAAVLYAPTDDLILDAWIGYETHNQGAGNWLAREYADPDLAAAKAERLEEFGANPYPGQVSFYNDVGGNGGFISQDVREYTDSESVFGIVHASYDAGAHNVDLFHGAFDQSRREVIDWDKTNFAAIMEHRPTDDSSTTTEIRVTSDYEGSINWIAGASYYKEDFEYKLARENGVLWAGSGIAGLGGEGGYYPVVRQNARDSMTSRGIFASVFADITDNLHLTAGLRWSEDSVRSGSTLLFNSAGVADSYVPLTEEDFSPEEPISHVSPRIALTYDLTPDLHLYGQFTNGFRAGYPNSVITVEAGGPVVVEHEELENYEVGLKGRLFENALSFALAVFYMDYTNLQSGTFIPADDPDNPFAFDVYHDFNAGNGTMKGFELEADWQVNPAFALLGSVGHTKAVIEEYESGDAVFRDVRNHQVRPWTAAASAVYTTGIGPDASLVLRADYQFQDESYWRGIFEPDPDYLVPSYHTVDVSATLERDRWSATAYFENILNEKYVTASHYTAFGYYTLYAQAYTPPRMFGVRLNFRFGAER